MIPLAWFECNGGWLGVSEEDYKKTYEVFAQIEKDHRANLEEMAYWALEQGIDFEAKPIFPGITLEEDETLTIGFTR